MDPRQRLRRESDAEAQQRADAQARRYTRRGIEVMTALHVGQNARIGGIASVPGGLEATYRLRPPAFPL